MPLPCCCAIRLAPPGSSCSGAPSPPPPQLPLCRTVRKRRRPLVARSCFISGQLRFARRESTSDRVSPSPAPPRPAPPRHISHEYAAACADRGVATPVGAVFWSLYQPGIANDNSVALHYVADFSLPTWFTLGGVGLMIPVLIYCDTSLPPFRPRAHTLRAAGRKRTERGALRFHNCACPMPSIRTDGIPDP